jgi:benzoylformate decarboxylase
MPVKKSATESRGAFSFGMSIASSRSSNLPALRARRSLWTAAKYAIPSIFICFVNHEYRLLKDLWCNAMGTTIETTHFVGMDFDNPNLDMQGIAAGFGARIEKIDKVGTIGEVLVRAQAYRGPTFVIIDREP